MDPENPIGDRERREAGGFYERSQLTAPIGLRPILVWYNRYETNYEKRVKQGRSFGREQSESIWKDDASLAGHHAA